MPTLAACSRFPLADLSSVRTSTHGLPGPFDVLVNNAGLFLRPLSRTADGFASRFRTTRPGHFHLTNLLLPHIRERGVTVASLGHWIGSPAFSDLRWERRPYRPNGACRIPVRPTSCSPSRVPCPPCTPHGSPVALRLWEGPAKLTGSRFPLGASTPPAS